MKLQRIRYFVTLAQTLNFSRTAQIHYVSQTTVSQQIRELERELGRDLFTRTKRKVELTPAGKLFLEEARKALDILDRADERVRLLTANDLLPLKIGLLNGITPAYIAPTLCAFKDANPDIAVSCSYKGVSDLYPDVIAGDVDAGLTYDVANLERANVLKTPVAFLTQYVVVSGRSHLAQHASLTRGELREERFVNALESRGFIPHAADAEGLQEGRCTDVLAESLDALLLALALGEGYTLLAEPMVQALPPSLGLAAIPLMPLEAERVPLVALSRNDAQSPAVERFLAYLGSLQMGA